MTEYAIKHRTTGRFLAVPPSLGVFVDTPEEVRAHRWEFRLPAELEVALIEDFRGAFDVVQIKALR